MKNTSNGHNIWLIDQVWGEDLGILVKFMDRDGTETKSSPYKLAKQQQQQQQKQKRPIWSSNLDGTSLVNKWFIIWLYEKFGLPKTVGSPERAT